jgi:hypothetical protein
VPPPEVVDDEDEDNVSALLKPDNDEVGVSLPASAFEESRFIESDAFVAFATALKTTILACCTMESNRAPVSSLMSALFRPEPIVPSGRRSKLAGCSESEWK